MATEDEPVTSLTSTKEGEDEDTGADPELLRKHPLENKWALWYFKNDRTKDWSENLKLVSTFEFIEDFWALYNYIQPASRLMSGCDYSVFKSGIQPAWEDERNKKGGRWMINLNKSQRNDELDRFWLEIVCMVYCCVLLEKPLETFSDDICGAVVNVRSKGDKVGVWTGNGANRDATLYIGRKLKERLQIPQQVIHRLPVA
ncbi:EIF4E [Bugula neritina]|uniref:EIF4E n=1 Tax=Bugula neritina TaxID=10212 RepID=A0A7J7JK46_BUGNE|nr:EIF4E [Bugula neritina]